MFLWAWHFHISRIVSQYLVCFDICIWRSCAFTQISAIHFFQNLLFPHLSRNSRESLCGYGCETHAGIILLFVPKASLQRIESEIQHMPPIIWQPYPAIRAYHTEWLAKYYQSLSLYLVGDMHQVTRQANLMIIILIIVFSTHFQLPSNFTKRRRTVLCSDWYKLLQTMSAKAPSLGLESLG